MGRRIIVGDVHGCREELAELLEAVRYLPGDDVLGFVGDLVDRGPDSPGVVRFVRDQCEGHGAVCVMGNHDEKYPRYRRRLAECGGDASRVKMIFPAAKREVFHRLPGADLDWLEARPYYHRWDGVLIVHAGVCPRRHRSRADLDIPRYRARLVRLRRVDAEGRMLGLDSPEPGRPWAETYDGRFGTVVYGHEPRDAVREDAHAVGIDTGCCFGGRLTALVLTDHGERRYVSVPAHRAYAPRREVED